MNSKLSELTTMSPAFRTYRRQSGRDPRLTFQTELAPNFGRYLSNRPSVVDCEAGLSSGSNAKHGVYK